MELIKENKMGNEKISSLLFKMSMPAIISMLVQALYNIIDSIFVAKYSSDGLTALTLAFPLQMLSLAFGLGIGVGTSSLISRRLGQHHKDEANIAAKTGISLAVITTIIFMILGTILPLPFLKLFSKRAIVLSYGVAYLSICMICCLGQMLDLVSAKILQGTGNMKIPMISQLAGAITNIVLDPILIFGFNMGVAGAAWATVIGQFVAMFISFGSLIFTKQEINFEFSTQSLNKKAFKDIISVGVPTTIMNAISSFATLLLNLILVQYSDIAVVVLGIYFKLQSFVFMPIFGLTQGTMPILGYNYGANQKERFYEAFYLTLKVSTIIMIFGLLLFQFGSGMFIKIFNDNPEYVKMGSFALRIISICFIPAAIGITTSVMFQSLGHGTKSMIMSLMRQAVLLIPLAYIFGKLMGVNAIWFTYPIVEVITAIIFFPIGLKISKKAFENA